MRFNTALLHGDFRGDKANGATLVPIYQSSAFKHESAEELERIFDNKAMGFSYTRISNPTVDAFEKRMTALEGGIASVACASGMAALYNAFCNILRAGDEIVSSASLYGGSIDLFRDLESFGITTRYVENNNLEEFRAATNEHTRLYFAETIGNPRLDVTDIEALAKLAHDNGVPLIMDNTVATAYLVQPLKLGADVVVNSTSKYINANSSAISGVITDAGRFKWDEDRYPGMKELQFAFDGSEDSAYLPYKYEHNCVVYTGTHDNETTKGWLEGLQGHDRDFVREYINCYEAPVNDCVWGLIRIALASVADLAVIPIQDYLCLGNEARMNAPATLGDNWKWRLTRGQISDMTLYHMREVTRIYGRLYREPVAEEPEEETEIEEQIDKSSNCKTGERRL